jgi:ribonuclease E
MTKNMLIDTAHAEETRVVVLDGPKIEEFDFESKSRRQLRGNIYLAKVTRVEPSLQAAFVEYGGNRHGFLAFNEIHPDYYQIPTADREALMRDAERADDDPVHDADPADPDSEVEAAGGEDDDEDVMEAEVARRRRRLLRRYKIQEVIRRRQIMLIQVVKEERGNKGAALTTYLSLAGRYGVLMPNTDRGGGISRKITAVADRKRLKTVVQGLDVPSGMGLIIRTAGAKRTKAEIKRDYDYLLRLWENIRDKTLHSVAPALIYEEEDLVKRALRDMFDKDIENIWVEGEAGFREAREFMRMIMPSQAKKVQLHRERTPLFVRHRAEEHLAQIYTPVVPLKSGGYLVINQTEALVAIDVNSGKATRERNIEATALKTNMEAAEEACRQMRLRDLAGLIVIDFIDMDEAKHNRAVEKKVKDGLDEDRARVQMGRISPFGLMEISRQRRRSGVLEGSTHVCPHCQGMGRIRSTESSALAALRAAEGEALLGGGALILRTPADVALFILNEKRADLARFLEVHGVVVSVQIESSLAHGEAAVERVGEVLERPQGALDYASDLPVEDDFDIEDEDEIEEEDDDLDGSEDSLGDDEEASEPRRSAVPASADREGDSEQGRRRNRRRRRGGQRQDETGPQPTQAAQSVEGSDPDDGDDEDSIRRRRRGRRGGRRGRDENRAGGFIWMRPRVPFGGDMYTWHDPSVLENRSLEGERRPRADTDRPRERQEQQSSSPMPTLVETATDNGLEALTTTLVQEPMADAWVELPPVAESKPKSRRKPARSNRKSEIIDEASTDAVSEPVAEPGIAEPVTLESSPPVMDPSPMPEAVAEPVSAEPEPAVEAPAPVLAYTSEPVEPDAAEITAPPEKPKRGWWRRG